MFMSVVERQRAILKDGCGKCTVDRHFGLGCLCVWSWNCFIMYCTPGERIATAPPVFMQAGMSVTWLHSRGNDKE